VISCWLPVIFLLDDQDYGDQRRLIGIVGFSLPGASNVPGLAATFCALCGPSGVCFSAILRQHRRGKKTKEKQSRSRATNEENISW